MLSLYYQSIPEGETNGAAFYMHLQTLVTRITARF
jgi:hypothetical protein